MTVPTSATAPHIPRLGSAVLLHGFSRGPRHLRVFSESLNREGVATVRPALSAFVWARSTNNSRYLTRTARRLAAGLPDGPVVVAGHSAGGAAGAWIAAELRDLGVDVTRLVLIDGVESPFGLMRRSWPRLDDVEVRAILAPPSPCNRKGELAEWLARQPGDIDTVLIPGSGHGDIEFETSAVYAWACDDASTEVVRRQVLDLAVFWVVEGLTRRR